MKLKFRAEAKDIIMFILFSIFCFYIVSIGVLNAMSILKDGTVHGLNPIPIFRSENIILAIILYLVVIIIAFTSVSSYFFEREKGVGVAVGKKEEKGYSRWCKDKEMKHADGIMVIKPTDDNIKSGGIPIYNNGKEVWVDTNTYHNMIIGSTGSGKSQGLSFPYINVMAKAGESMIITDPKGELYEGTAKELEKRGYNIIILNFRNPEKGNCWNPFTVPYKLYQQGNIDKSIELLEDLAQNILYDESSKADPFWCNTSADYFAGLAWALFQDGKEEEVNINSINYMASVGEQRLGGTNYMKEYFSGKAPTSTESIKVNSTITAPNETKGSILSVFNQKIQLFSSRDTLSEMLSRSDFDMEDIGRKKTAVFIVVQDEKKTYHSLVTIFLKQCYETLVRVAQENPGGKLKYRTNFLMDEFANMPPLSDVDAMVSAARSRNIRLSFIIQNFSQLNDVYGKEKAETIRGNCSNTIYLLSTELAALEEISKMCGEVKSKKDDKTDSRPLVTVTDLQNLKEEEALILRSRMRPFKTKLKYDHKIEWGMSKEKADYPERQKQEVKLFDLKSFVEAQREKKINDMLNGNSSKNDMPPMGIGGFDPGSMFGRREPKPNPGFNMDDLVKRIDAKIAELEEEERKEKEELAKQKSGKVTIDKKDIQDDTSIKTPGVVVNLEKKPVEAKIEEIPNKIELKPIVEHDINKTSETIMEKPASIISEEKPKIESTIEKTKPIVEETKIVQPVITPVINNQSKELNDDIIDDVNNIVEEKQPDLVQTELKEEPIISDIPTVEQNTENDIVETTDDIVVDSNSAVDDEDDYDDYDDVTDDQFFDDFFSDE